MFTIDSIATSRITWRKKLIKSKRSSNLKCLKGWRLKRWMICALIFEDVSLTWDLTPGVRLRMSRMNGKSEGSNRRETTMLALLMVNLAGWTGLRLGILASLKPYIDRLSWPNTQPQQVKGKLTFKNFQRNLSQVPKTKIPNKYLVYFLCMFLSSLLSVVDLKINKP